MIRDRPRIRAADRVELSDLEEGARQHAGGLEGPSAVRLRVAVDFAALALASIAAILGAGPADLSVRGAGYMGLLPFLGVGVLALRRLYRPRLRIAILDGFSPVLGGVSVAALTLLTVLVLFGSAPDAGLLVVRAWVFATCFVVAGRVVLDVVHHRARQERRIYRNTLIVGAGEIGRHLAHRLGRHPEYGLRPVGFLDADPLGHGDDDGPPVCGTPDDIEAVAAATGASHVVFAFTREPDRDVLRLLQRCSELGLAVSIVPRFYEAINDRMALEHVGGLPVIAVASVDPLGWQFAIKHAIDRFVAGVALVVLGGVLLVLAVAVRRSSPGPVLFRQHRVGRDGQPFEMLKFRTMREEPGQTRFTPAAGSAPGGVEGADRRTRVGTWLRRTSLDELPQLVNVVRGQMSLVGPRPERPEYVETFDAEFRRYADRHRVRAGITGWSQVHGLRGQTSIADRIEWDNFYIENWSLGLDLKIMVMTVLTVLARDPA